MGLGDGSGPRQRNLEMLKQTVRRIYAAIVRTEFVIHEQYPEITPCLPEEITFVHAEDALQRYPRLTPEQREYELAREHGAIFVIGIGGQLSDGRVHGGRAPDYDDWTTETAPGYAGLNGDIVVWDPVRQNSLELSSMGIRVDDVALLRQLELTGTMDRRQLYWHTRLLQGELPQTIGGGIGQSRLCMFLLRKAHIGEVQASVWPDTIRNECMESGVQLM